MVIYLSGSTGQGKLADPKPIRIQEERFLASILQLTTYWHQINGIKVTSPRSRWPSFKGQDYQLLATWLQGALLNGSIPSPVTMNNNSRHPRAILNEDNPVRRLVQCLAQMCSQPTFAWHIATACCHHYSKLEQPASQTSASSTENTGACSWSFLMSLPF